MTLTPLRRSRDRSRERSPAIRPPPRLPQTSGPAVGSPSPRQRDRSATPGAERPRPVLLTDEDSPARPVVSFREPVDDKSVDEDSRRSTRRRRGTRGRKRDDSPHPHFAPGKQNKDKGRGKGKGEAKGRGKGKNQTKAKDKAASLELTSGQRQTAGSRPSHPGQRQSAQGKKNFVPYWQRREKK